jgi:hypothetical protein
MIDEIWELINVLPCEPNVVGESSAAALRVAPNPARLSWRVESPLPASRWTLLDLRGRVVGSGSIHGKNFCEVDATALDAGNYLLSLELVNGGTLHERLMKR